MSGTGINRADLWLGTTAPNPQQGNIESRSYDTQRLIDEKWSLVILKRRDPDTGLIFHLPEQRVRIEVAQNPRTSSDQRDTQLDVSKQYTVLVGMPDLDVRRADTFYYQGRDYIVNDVIDTNPWVTLVSAELRP